MKVRLAIPADEDEFTALAIQAHEESYPHLPVSEAKIRGTFTRYLATAHPTLTVAVKNDGTLVGFCSQTISEYPSADGLYTTLEVTFVRPDSRGTRAAALLLRWFTDWSDRIGALESTGGNDNQLRSEATAKLLSRFGFEPVGIFVRRRKGAAIGQKGRIGR
jgi:GNAT superfamily N-acetyltransferase